MFSNDFLTLSTSVLVPYIGLMGPMGELAAYTGLLTGCLPVSVLIFLVNATSYVVFGGPVLFSSSLSSTVSYAARFGFWGAALGPLSCCSTS